jgi:hypothetical protein
MMTKLKWFDRIAVGIIVFIGIGFMFTTVGPAGNRMSPTHILQFESAHRLGFLGKLVRQYESENGGNTPRSLKDLVRYLDGDDCGVFYLSNSHGPADRFTNPDLLDEYASYKLVNKADSTIVISEKPGLYSDGTVAVGFRDGTVKRLSPKKYRQLKLP